LTFKKIKSYKATHSEVISRHYLGSTFRMSGLTSEQYMFIRCHQNEVQIDTNIKNHHKSGVLHSNSLCWGMFFTLSSSQEVKW